MFIVISQFKSNVLYWTDIPVAYVQGKFKYEL